MQIRNIKAAELARRTGLSKPCISQYVNGIYEAKQTALHKLALALNVSEAWLMGFDVTPDRRPARPPKSEADRLLEKLNRLDEIDRAKIEERIDMLLENEKYIKKEVG